VKALGRWDAIPATANGMAVAPVRTNHTPGTVAAALALWSVREWDAALPATVPCTDRRQQLPRAHLRTSQPSIALLPSKPPLFGYKTRHDDWIAARIVRTAAYSTTWRTTLPHVAK
jgi:hypothetical protein